MNVYINRGLETSILVSDDSDFVNILRLASMRNLQTIVIGDTMTLSRHVDISFSWDEVASGRAQSATTEAHLNKAALMKELEDDSDLYPERDDDSEFDPLRPNSTVSASSEDEEWERDDGDADASTREDDSDEEESAFEDFSPWSRNSVSDESSKVD